MEMKQCKGACGLLKPLSCFGVLRKSKDGLRSECKECNRKRVNQYDSEHRAKKCASARHYELIHKDRISAVNKARYALKHGKIKAPLFCERCGYEPWKHMHHEDYSKPFNVQFLCASCHKLAHT